MEFFRIVKADTTEEDIQSGTRLEDLEQISSELIILNEPHGEIADIGGLWGEFTLIRQQINGGVRFTLKECPNALSWTITTGFDPAPESIVVHLTINRTEKGEDFIEEINEFLDDLCSNLELRFSEEKLLKN